MKRILIAALAFVLIAGIVYAQTELNDEDYQNMERMRAKIVKMKRELDRFTNEIIQAYPPQQSVPVSDMIPDIKVDVAETDKEVIVKADMPGMDKDKIEITLERAKFLRIAGSREAFTSKSGPGVVQQERVAGRFERVVELPSECMNEGIKASYKSGVLEVVIPKKSADKTTPVKISIQ